MILECIRDAYLYNPNASIGLTLGQCYEVVSLRLNHDHELDMRVIVKMTRYDARGVYIHPCVESIVEIKEFLLCDYDWSNQQQHDFWFKELYRKIQEDDKYIHVLVNTEFFDKINTLDYGFSDYKRIVIKVVEWSRDIKLDNILG